VKLDEEPPALVSSTAAIGTNGGTPVLTLEVVAEDASGLAKAAPFTVVAGDKNYGGYLRYNKSAKIYQGTVQVRRQISPGRASPASSWRRRRQPQSLQYPIALFHESQFMRNLAKAGLILVGALVAALPAAAEEMPAFIDYGAGARPRQGDNDHRQAIYLSVPAATTGKLYLRVFDPDTGGAFDQIDKRYVISTTRFAVFGGTGAFIPEQRNGEPDQGGDDLRHTPRREDLSP